MRDPSNWHFWVWLLFVLDKVVMAFVEKWNGGLASAYFSFFKLPTQLPKACMAFWQCHFECLAIYQHHHFHLPPRNRIWCLLLFLLAPFKSIGHPMSFYTSNCFMIFYSYWLSKALAHVGPCSPHVLVCWKKIKQGELEIQAQ